jgi:hypothetical protein
LYFFHFEQKSLVQFRKRVKEIRSVIFRNVFLNRFVMRGALTWAPEQAQREKKGVGWLWKWSKNSSFCFLNNDIGLAFCVF